MSTGRRAYDMMRGYVNREWERIRGIELDSAQKELDEAMKQPLPRNLQPDAVPDQIRSTSDPKGYARKLLGVSETVSFGELRKCFERLNKRSDPNNFPEGSPEREQAAQIQRRVSWAYNTLSADMPVDETERRFRSLELD